MVYTKYGFLSDAELVSMIEAKNPTSPLILELLARFEIQIHPEMEIVDLLTSSRTTFECPECEALLDIQVDAGGDQLYFGLKKV